MNPLVRLHPLLARARLPLAGRRLRERRRRADEVGPARRLSGEQLPHREPAAVRQRRRQGDRRQAQDHVHANASLFKANEIKRAVQGGQAQMGEILLTAYSNEWPIFGIDGLPFLADSYAAAMKLVQGEQAGAREEARPSRE